LSSGRRRFRHQRVLATHLERRGGRRVSILRTDFPLRGLSIAEDRLHPWGFRIRHANRRTHGRFCLQLLTRESIHGSNPRGTFDCRACVSRRRNRVERAPQRVPGTKKQNVPFSPIDALRWIAEGADPATLDRLLVLPLRPGRFEPRVRKRRPKQFPVMQKPRGRLKEDLMKCWNDGLS
jgi:hypothetical protein